MKRNITQRSIDFLSKAQSQAAKEARESERKWWVGEILKLLNEQDTVIHVSQIMKIVEKRQPRKE